MSNDNNEFERYCKLRRFIRILALMLFFLAATVTGHSASIDNGEVSENNIDSLHVYHKKYKSRSTLETIVSSPGFLIYAPLKIVFEGQKFIIAQAFEGNFLARVLDVLTTDDGKRGILPTYSSSAGGGLKFFQKGLFTPNSKLSLSATAGLRERQQYRLKLKNIELGKRVNVQFLTKYHFQSDESFYGIGPETEKADRTNFANELVTAELNIGVQISGKNRIGIMAGFDRNDISRGRNDRYPSSTEVAAFASLPGMETEVQIGKLELEIHHDSKNHPGSPTSGFEILLRGGIFQQVDDNQFGFSHLTVDASRYFHLFYNRTLKLRLAGEFTETFEDRQIPFYYLSEVGRSETVRGFARGRFRDKDMVLGSMEYIYPIWQVINAQIFLDGGMVAQNIPDEFNLDRMKIGYGVGFQYWSIEEVVFDFNIARSEDGFRFYLGLNKSL